VVAVSYLDDSAVYAQMVRFATQQGDNPPNTILNTTRAGL
jgi:hypothetical protein